MKFQRNLRNTFNTLTALLLMTVTVSAMAAAPAVDPSTLRVGLGQASAMEPAKISGLRLTDPLVQQKYLNEPDMMRFLRGTYSEACTRGLVDKAAKQIKADLQKQFTAEQRKAATLLLENRRVWKLTSFEMEAWYGNGYLTAANYCDCVMREVADIDLVNPRKGLEVIEKLSQTTQRTCEATAKEQTARQVKAREAKK